MNLYSAVSTPVRIVDASTNEAKVELRDFQDTEFTMRLYINDSDTDVVYNVDISVLTDYLCWIKLTEFRLYLRCTNN